MISEDHVDNKYPSWNGCWTKWQDYQLRVELKAAGTKEDELQYLGPRLASNLTGKAFESIAEVNKKELQKPEGWKYLIAFLERSRGREKVDLLGDAFNEFFVRREVYRKDGEEFSDYEPRFKTLTRRLEKALKESGSEGKLPSEVLGWYLLNCYMRMDPSDIANVRGRADSYKLDEIVKTLQKMWSGGGLAEKDKEMKRRRGGQALMVDEPMNGEDGECYQQTEEKREEDDVEDEELEEVATWYQDAYVALVDEPDDHEVLANFREARRALDQARVSRGFYPVRSPDGQKGRGKGKGKGYGKGNYTRENEYANKICIRCGRKGHIARICPQRAQGDQSGRPQNSGKVGFVGALCGTVRVEDATEAQGIWNTNGRDSPLRGKAVLDSGASDNVIGVNTLQDLGDLYEELGLSVEDEFDIDRNIHKNFVYGGDHSSKALALARLNLGVLGREMSVEVHVVEGSTPLLLSAKFLYDSKATIDFRKGTAVFEGIHGEAFQLERSAGNHLLLPVTVFGGARDLMKHAKDDPPEVPELSEPSPGDNAPCTESKGDEENH